MANEKIPLMYKGHPLRRKDNLIYYGDMADSHIILLQIMDTKPVGDMNVATKVSFHQFNSFGQKTQRDVRLQRQVQQTAT